MKLYLAGPMAGYPDRNFPAFHEAAARLRAFGHEVVNPAESNAEYQGAALDDRAARAICMRKDIENLMTCEGVATMNRWQSSKGAFCEVTIAEQLNMPVRSVEWFCLEVGTEG